MCVCLSRMPLLCLDSAMLCPEYEINSILISVRVRVYQRPKSGVIWPKNLFARNGIVDSIRIELVNDMRAETL